MHGGTSSELDGLMGQVQQGDRLAYRRLLNEVVPILRGTIRSRRPFLSVHDIEDLVQDILLSMHIARATYDPRRSFRPWLMGIAQHRISYAARSYLRHGANEVATGELPEK